MSCRICGAQKLDLFLHFPQMPAMVEQLLKPGQVSGDRPLELTVERCPGCGFIQLPKSPLPEDYYLHYDKSPVHAERNRLYQEGLAQELVARFDLPGRMILEAGCGDGYFASQLNGLGARVLAVEPGGPAGDMARGRGVEVVRGYLSPDLDLEAGSFDAFVARQVLSHVEGLTGFAAAVSRFLKPGGLGFLECPDVNLVLKERRFYDFFPDYVNYFSPDSLWQLLTRTGFEVLESSSRQDGEYFLTVFQKPESVDLAGIFSGFTTSLRSIVAGLRAQGKRVACWGAGGRGVSLLVMAGLGREEISYVIDSSPLKQGRLTPASHLEVVPPERLRTDPVEAIIITAVMFQEEILKDLRTRLDYQGELILLLPEPHLA